MPPIPDLSSLADRLDALLPQTQCRRCGYDGCRPYAEAIAAGAAINRCPPGGDPVIATLAALTGQPAAPLDRACGEHGPHTVARVDESRCIGCALCIAACPVDAIVGAPKRMHAVLSALCAGCELCLAPCPVDCIDMVPAGRTWSPEDARAARARHDVRRRRLAAGSGDPAQTLPVAASSSAVDGAIAARQHAVAAALARARARRAGAAKATPT